MSTLQIGQELGDYRIVELLGAGGMGEVYRAEHTRITRTVAIKVLTAGPTGEHAARFENEARIQAGLTHDNLAALYDYVEAGGKRCLIMEFVPGESLAERLRRQRRVGPAEALDILKQVAAASAYMHARGIVHRDLKPSNVRITSGGLVKVLDFGIAKGAETPGLTAAGEVVGTPEYVSPEQLKTGRATPRSDVWALGVLLHEMVTGRVPFPGQFPNQVWAAIERSPRLSVARDVDDARMALRIDQLLARCLTVDPRLRFSTAEGIVRALQQPLETGPSSQAPATPRRSLALPRWAWISASVATVLLILAAVNPFGPARADQTRHRIAVSEGTASVAINGETVGRTPYEYRARRGEVVALELRRPGFAPIVERFDISTRTVWTFTMRPAQERR